MTLTYVYPTPLPSTKGWGPGWPHCQAEARAVPSIFWPGVHRDIGELVGLLVAEMRRRGFTFLDPGCWGFGCRGTKASSGSGTDVPSFHSWGLALDVNAPLNVYGADREDTQLGKASHRWVIDLMHDYGWFWLGPDIRDWMHFSFVGSPADARGMTQKARREIGDEMAYADFERGLRDSRQGRPLDPNGNADYDLGWALGDSIKDAKKLPLPGTPGPHKHITGDPLTDAP